MIIIIFVTLAIVYYLIQHFENRRKERNEESREKRRDAYMHLLNSLQTDKKEKDDVKE